MDPTDAFANLMRRDDDEIELDRAALLFAAVEYPDLDVEAAIRELDHLADLLQPRLAGLDGPEQVVQVVARDTAFQFNFHAQLHQHTRSLLVRHEERVDRR